jgi:hypothetical protein
MSERQQGCRSTGAYILRTLQSCFSEAKILIWGHTVRVLNVAVALYDDHPRRPYFDSSHSFLRLSSAMQFLTVLSLCATITGVLALPNEPPRPYSPAPTLVRRTDPTFPTDVPSCVQCEPNYPNINSCAQAAPVFENASMVRPISVG